MLDDDFDMESLAAYLHLAPSQLARLVERGKLPGRKVAGGWRFAPAEIHHWLEERIGLSGEDELLRVEGALEASDLDEQAPPLRLAELLPAEAIQVPLQARTRDSVIRSMVELAARTGWLWDTEKMADAIRGREEMHPTALESGVALLHPRRPLPSILGRAFLSLGRTKRGIPFGGSRGVLTDVFFVICSLDDRGHLRLLARLSRLIAWPGFLEELRALDDPRAIRDLIATREEALPA